MLGVPAADHEAVFDEEEFIPDASDLEAQRCSQPIRKGVRTNAMLHERSPAHVDWTPLQYIRQHLASGLDTPQHTAEKVEVMVAFISTFMQAMNTRLGERDDLFLLGPAPSLILPRGSSTSPSDKST